MKISVITCTYNSARYLAATIESVRRQTYGDLEHIFIDGGSTDGTLEIIKKYYPAPVLFIGQDQGLYDALNKGLERATGEVVGFLHSDDCFADDRCLERIAEAFAHHDIDYYSARLAVYYEKLEKPFAVLGAAPHKFSWRDALYSSNYFAHPTVYVKKTLLPKIGNFNLSYKIAADIDWLWRLEAITDKCFFDKQVLVKMRHVGKSSRHYFQALAEEYQIAKKHFGLTPLVLFTYSYHWARRLVRFILEKIGLFKVVAYSRRLLIKLDR